MADKAPTDFSFEAWVAHVFDHEVTKPEWYFSDDADYWDGPNATTVAYITRLFEDPIPHLEGYADAQLNQGFWYLINNSCSDFMFALLDESVAWNARSRCLGSFHDLFAKLLAERCTATLSHLDEKPANPMNSICYMGWDIVPLHEGMDVRNQRDFNDNVMAVMSRTLSLPSVACQESALHGLGHWQMYYSDEVRHIVDSFLARNPSMNAALRKYADAARAGAVL